MRDDWIETIDSLTGQYLSIKDSETKAAEPEIGTNLIAQGDRSHDSVIFAPQEDDGGNTNPSDPGLSHLSASGETIILEPVRRSRTRSPTKQVVDIQDARKPFVASSETADTVSWGSNAVIDHHREHYLPKDSDVRYLREPLDPDPASHLLGPSAATSHTPQPDRIWRTAQDDLESRNEDHDLEEELDQPLSSVRSTSHSRKDSTATTTSSGSGLRPYGYGLSAAREEHQNSIADSSQSPLLSIRPPSTSVLPLSSLQPSDRAVINLPTTLDLQKHEDRRRIGPTGLRPGSAFPRHEPPPRVRIPDRGIIPKSKGDNVEHSPGSSEAGLSSNSETLGRGESSGIPISSDIPSRRHVEAEEEEEEMVENDENTPPLTEKGNDLLTSRSNHYLSSSEDPVLPSRPKTPRASGNQKTYSKRNTSGGGRGSKRHYNADPPEPVRKRARTSAGDRRKGTSAESPIDIGESD